MERFPPRDTAKKEPEHDLLSIAGGSLDRVAKLHVRIARRTLEPGALDRAMRVLQRHLGARWINASLTNLRHVHGLERLPPLAADQSFILVANHRSFFDLYAVSALLVAGAPAMGLAPLPHRLVFPVRANFFYDGNPLGIFVNGAMSFFAMYPPIFREQVFGSAKWVAAANLAGVDEVVRILHRGGALVGLHPEGARKKDGDPYTFLPAQNGVGRIIHKAKVPVIPVFVNGLVNSIPQQIAGNVTGRGAPVFIVFGAPVDFGGDLERPGSPRLYKKISERALEAIGALGAEERELRARLPR